MITDLEARKIASEWHGGQTSALYALSSSGAIIGEQSDEFDYNDAAEEISQSMRALSVVVRDRTNPLATRQDALNEFSNLCDLARYVRVEGPRGPQPGWSDLTW